MQVSAIRYLGAIGIGSGSQVHWDIEIIGAQEEEEERAPLLYKCAIGRLLCSLSLRSGVGSIESECHKVTA